MKFLGSRLYRLVKLSLYTAIGLQLTVSTAAASAQQDDDADFRTAMLKKHNQERQLYHYNALSWSEKLAKDARSWAESLSRQNRFEHAFAELRQKDQGENLWMGTAGYFSHSAMVQMWLDEKRLVKDGVFPNVTNGRNWAEVGHYTQIIWPQTREVGCALARGAVNEFLVCRYLPAGNVIGTKMAFR